MTELQFAVIGIPAPQGSKSISRYGRMYESSRKVGPWRAAVEWAACVAARQESWVTRTGAVEVTIMFSLPAPKRMPKGRVRPHVKPDLDKLIRSTLDAITASNHVYLDDAQVVRVAASKWYTPEGKQPGALVTITDVAA